jgi:hypothetical protein
LIGNDIDLLGGIFFFRADVVEMQQISQYALPSFIFVVFSW